MSYATGRRSSPVSLADARVLPVSVAAEAGAQRGPRRAGSRRVLGRAASWAALVYSWAAVPSGRSNNCGCDLFLILFALLFHSFVLVFKNLYCLVYRSKCYGSNFVGFLVLSSI